MAIPLVLALWEHPNFQGRKRLFIENTEKLGLTCFDNTASAVGVHPGPDYAAWKAANGGQEPTVTLFENENYAGARLTLMAGEYANIDPVYNFGDKVSSLKFNDPLPVPGPIPVKLIVTLFEHDNHQGARLVVVQDSEDIRADFGNEFNDMASSLTVEKGPDYTAGDMVWLYRDPAGNGGAVSFGPGNNEVRLGNHNFDNVTTSISIGPSARTPW